MDDFKLTITPLLELRIVIMIIFLKCSVHFAFIGTSLSKISSLYQKIYPLHSTQPTLKQLIFKSTISSLPGHCLR